jgi:hypothetical protein
MNDIVIAEQAPNKNVKFYINGQKNSLEADFLLLDKAAQTLILENFEVSDIKELLSNINIPRLWTLELSILYNLSVNELVRRVWIVREKFRSLCGPDMYSNYYSSLPDCLQESALRSGVPLDSHQTELLRDDTVAIARQLQRLAFIRIRRSESINERKRFVIQSTFFIMVLGFVVFCLLDSGIDIIEHTEAGKSGAKFLLLVVGSGVIGSAISMLQRIEKAANIPPAITDSLHDTMQITLSMSNWYITSLLVCGAVFALLVHFISVAHLVNVLDILPDVSAMKIPENTTILEQLLLPPDSRTDMAKLMLACFISGFAERMVPDILDSLVKKSELNNSENKDK